MALFAPNRQAADERLALLKIDAEVPLPAGTHATVGRLQEGKVLLLPPSRTPEFLEPVRRPQ